MNILWRLIAILTLQKFAVQKTYADGGRYWTEENCSPFANKQLSPINIIPKDIACDDGFFADLHFSKNSTYQGFFSYRGDPKTLRIDIQSGTSTLYLQNKNSTILRYSVRELVFRTPSEHGYNSTVKPLEAQFFYEINESYRNYTSIHNIGVSMLYNEDASADDESLFSAFIDTIKGLEPKELTPKKLETPFSFIAPGFHHFSNVLQYPLKFLLYEGTKTDGNCEAGITWMILEQEFSVTPEYVQLYRDILHTIGEIKTNARAVQNFHDVMVYRGGAKCSDYFPDFVLFGVTYIFLMYFILKRV